MSRFKLVVSEAFRSIGSNLAPTRLIWRGVASSLK